MRRNTMWIQKPLHFNEDEIIATIKENDILLIPAK